MLSSLLLLSFSLFARSIVWTSPACSLRPLLLLMYFLVVSVVWTYPPARRGMTKWYDEMVWYDETSREIHNLSVNHLVVVVCCCCCRCCWCSCSSGRSVPASSTEAVAAAAAAVVVIVAAVAQINRVGSQEDTHVGPHCCYSSD